ncbi:DNA-directed RNA polymerase III subunit RPC9-like [Iris pallida]|uniref:DNA-directed RNA polymerase III subunit RPC9 n=1 Tax=Iris pallida TaxID=29817 RepID=A0AAX6EJ58_IRIPA|nr:DNA-directed RNA polymerase III subunit RPC9-like [Iris pallida]
MKILRVNAGALTDFEVLDFFRSRGATSDPMGCIGAVTRSECEVFDYLNNSAACNQTREAICDFVKRCEKFKLAKAEILNIINVRPSTEAEIDPLIERVDERFRRDEAEGPSEVCNLLNLVVEVLPPPPKSEEEEATDEQETMASGEQETMATDEQET